MRIWKVVFVLCVIAASSTAHAQGIATSFNELRPLVRPGDTLNVTSNKGREVTGTLVDLSPGTLVMRVGERRAEWLEGDVATIGQRRGDSLANGAIWGLVIGAGGVGAATAIAAGANYEINGGSAALATVVCGGIGAGVGVAIDAMISKQVVIFERRSTTAVVGVAPILTAGRQGVLLSIAF